MSESRRITRRWSGPNAALVAALAMLLVLNGVPLVARAQTATPPGQQGDQWSDARLGWDTVDGASSYAPPGAEGDQFAASAAQQDFETPTFTPTPTQTPTPTLIVPTSTIPPTTTPQVAPAPVSAIPREAEQPPMPDYCFGDETVFFVPLEPYAGTDVIVAISTHRRHDVRYMHLTAPVRPGGVTERRGLHGWVYEWTFSPPVEGYYEVNFYVDGAIKCLTASFPALPAFGTIYTPTVTPTPTLTPTATETPAATSTATATPIPAPVISARQPINGGCNQLMTVSGTGFGSSQSINSGQIYLSGSNGVFTAQVLGWTTNQITVSTPRGLSAGLHDVVVSTSGGSATTTYTVDAGAPGC